MHVLSWLKAKYRMPLADEGRCKGMITVLKPMLNVGSASSISDSPVDSAAASLHAADSALLMRSRPRGRDK